MGQATSAIAPPAVAPMAVDPASRRSQRGRRNFLSGLAAEERVAARYRDLGYHLRARRWRGSAGEIDLIFEDRGGVVFVEVKMAASHERAGEALRPAQMRRIAGAAAEYLGSMPSGQLTPARIDVALVDGLGRIVVLRNAIGH